MTVLVAGRCFGLPRQGVRRILPMAQLLEPPNRPPLLAGLVRLPDQVVPVVRLNRLLGLDDSPATTSTALVWLRGSSPRALLVDQALAVLRVGEDRLRPVPRADTFNGVVRAEIVLDAGSCLLLVPDRLLMREEEERIDAFRHLAESRLAGIAGGNP